MFPWSVRDDERRLTAALAGYFFLVVAALYLMKPARAALFLQDRSADDLPYVYIATALVTWWVVVAYVRFVDIGNLQRTIQMTLAASLVCLAGFWLWFWPWFWAPPSPAGVDTGVFYIWVKVYAVLLPSQFWLLSEEILDPRQARRLFGPVGAGGVLGGITGSAAALAIAGLLGTRYLLVMAGLTLAGALVLFRFALAEAPRVRLRHTTSRDARPPADETTGDHADSADESQEQLSAPHGRALVITIAAILIVATTAHTILDWQFNKVAADSFPTADGKAVFFAGFFAVLNIVTLVIQVLATSFILRYFGIGLAMALLPAAMAVGAVGILLHPQLWVMSLARGADDALRLSVDQSGRELLFLPFTSADRQRLKPRIDLFASRAANGLGGVIILGAIWWLDDPKRYLSVVSLLLVAAWAVLVLRARYQYADTLQHLLRVRDLDISSLARSRLDANASDAIRQGLASGDRDTIHAALALAEHTDPTAFVDELRELLPTTADPELRGQILRLLADVDDRSSIDAALSTLEEADESSVAEVLTYACVTRDPEARERIFEYLDRPGVILDREDLRSTLAALLKDESPHVARAALSAYARFPVSGLVPAICETGTRRPVESAALQALQILGHEAVGALTGVLADPRNSRSRRRFAARALGRIGDADAAGGLIAGLVAEDRKVRRATLKALNYMRRRGENLDIGRDSEAAAIAIEWRDYLSLHRLAAALGPPGTDSPKAFVATVVAERLWEAEEQLFRALALRHSIQAVFFAYRGLITGDKTARNHAIELVDSMIETPQRRTLVRLLETADRAGRGRIAAQELGRPVPLSDAALQELLAPGDPWLAACAIRALDTGTADIRKGVRQELEAHDYAPLKELLSL